MKNIQELPDIIDQIELPEKYNNYYIFRMESLFERIKQDLCLQMSDSTIQENLKIGEIIIKNEIIEYDIETTLAILGYELFQDLTYNEFTKELETNSTFSKNITEGKIFIGYINDFSRMVLVTKTYYIPDVVHTLIN